MTRAQCGNHKRKRYGLAAALATLVLGSFSAWGEEISSPQFRGQDITVIEGEDRTLYEFRQNGELRAIRVVPKLGKPYTLVPADPTEGYGNLERADRWLPQWILLEF